MSQMTIMSCGPIVISYKWDSRQHLPYFGVIMVLDAFTVAMLVFDRNNSYRTASGTRLQHKYVELGVLVVQSNPTSK